MSAPAERVLVRAGAMELGDRVRARSCRARKTAPPRQMTIATAAGTRIVLFLVLVPSYRQAVCRALTFSIRIATTARRECRHTAARTGRGAGGRSSMRAWA